MSNLRCVHLMLLISVLYSACAHAHNLNFGTLTINESVLKKGSFQLLFQMSGDQGSHLSAKVEVPDSCTIISDITEQKDKIRLRYRQELDCEATGLAEKLFLFSGLPANANVLVRALRDSTLIEERLLTGDVSQWQIGNQVEQLSIISSSYIALGVEHILAGWDHLLFLCMLMLLVQSRRKLIQVVTAFTVGHSITLVLATVKVISVAAPPTEALIALSIVFVAAEIISFHQRHRTTMTIVYPGSITLLFGLLHGLGFASVLNDIGIAEDQVFVSLLGFNLGVELGQLLFVSVLLGFSYLKQNAFSKSVLTKSTLAYVGGSVGAFWLVERIAAF